MVSIVPTDSGWEVRFNKGYMNGLTRPESVKKVAKEYNISTEQADSLLTRADDRKRKSFRVILGGMLAGTAIGSLIGAMAKAANHLSKVGTGGFWGLVVGMVATIPAAIIHIALKGRQDLKQIKNAKV